MNARIEELFHALADLDAAARLRYFAEHDVDAETRDQVEALLAFDSGASLALRRGVSAAASRVLPQLEARGARCGPYLLLEVVGRGGMGAVYLAERADGEVTQRLAVKLLPPGAGNLQRERFLQERQILAALTHPNIARMLDAGHLDDGQPFLAMEYVDGKPIDVFAAGLGIRQSIRLFLKVCAAVGYLHRNLVVHRDLKPSNILVTSEGEPKLLDFGIAKILDVAADSMITGMRMLTPDYASPEQVTGGRISTATDIYSMGAVLYLLLTGKPAHEFADRSAEAIASAIASREVTRPGKWAPELKGDLELILLKALRKDPQERYATAEQFAEDLESYLESRPVRARSGGLWYRARKFLRRYWVPAVAAALVIASLSVGLYVANRQRVVAQQRFRQLRQLSNRVLFDVDGELMSVPGTIKARGKIVSALTQYLENLHDEALRDRDLALEASETYLRVARTQGVPVWIMLGQYADAEESLGKGAALVDLVLQKDPRNRRALLLSADIAHDRAVTAYALRRTGLVLAQSPIVQRRFEQLARMGDLTLHAINAGAYIYGDLAEVHIALHRFNEAARYARLGIEISRNSPSIPGPRAQAFGMLAGSLMYLGDFEGAVAATEEARKLVEQGKYDDERYRRLIVWQFRCREGLILGEDGGVNLGRPQEAVAAFQRAFDAVEELTRTSADDYQSELAVATAGGYLGNILRHSDARHALEVYDHSLMRVRQIPNDIAARREEALLLACSSYAARMLHREKDARDRIDAAFRLLRDAKDYPSEVIAPGSEPDIALRALADHYAGTGQRDKALETYRELRRKLIASNPEPRNDLLNAVYISQVDASYATLLRDAGRSDEAAVLRRNTQELWQAWDSKLPKNPFVLSQINAAFGR